MAALTLSLQLAVPLAFLAFGLLALAVVRRAPGMPGAYRQGWLLLGAAFIAHGGVMLVHNTWAVAAYVAGPAAQTYRAFVEWTPALNHGRTFLLLAFTLTMAAHALLPARRDGRFFAAACAVMAAGFAGGALVGGLEAERSVLTHFTAVATWDVVELVVLLATLFVVLLRSRIDRLAWLALAVYAFSLALNVMWIAALSRREIAGEWSPSPWMIHAYRLVLTLAMAAAAARRLQLARRNVQVGALMEAPPSRLRMVG